MLEDQAKVAVESIGKSVRLTTFIPEGRSHNIYSIDFQDGSEAIARFEKLRPDLPTPRRDFNFNGLVSLGREVRLTELVRSAGLPAPLVYGLHESEMGSFLLVEKMNGSYWTEFLEKSAFSRKAYLDSLRFLGGDLARLHSIKFTTYGDVVGPNLVLPGNITSFHDRLQQLVTLKVERAQTSGALDDVELAEVSGYLRTQLACIKSESKEETSEQPTLILTDLHPMNFFVDGRGKPSGYFDLETCQSGLPELEFYNLRMHLFNYFHNTFNQAEVAFFEGYHANGGSYNPNNPANKRLSHILTISHLISTATSYFKASDGVRDDWSTRMKRIIFDGMNADEINHLAIGDIFRGKTKQPINSTA